MAKAVESRNIEATIESGGLEAGVKWFSTVSDSNAPRNDQEMSENNSVKGIHALSRHKRFANQIVVVPTSIFRAQSGMRRGGQDCNLRSNQRQGSHFLPMDTLSAAATCSAPAGTCVRL